MKTKKLKSWHEFQSKVIDPFCKNETVRNSPFWFRGQSDAAWPLKTTLDRFRLFHSNAERMKFYKTMMDAFRNEIVGIEASNHVPDGEGLELLARHHGLPSALLDWSRSPYVAAYFAFENALYEINGANVVIWTLNCRLLDIGGEIERIEDRRLLWYNRRALEQAGVFIRVNSINETTEDLFGSALTKYEIPASETRIALRYLEAMNITSSTLFRDLDGAARTVKARMVL